MTPEEIERQRLAQEEYRKAQEKLQSDYLAWCELNPITLVSFEDLHRLQLPEGKQ